MDTMTSSVVKQKAQEDYMKALHAVFYIVVAEGVIAAIASFSRRMSFRGVRKTTNSPPI